MITFLDGKLVNALPTQATVDVGGIGYEVFIPLSSYDKLPVVGQPIRILTHLAVREDAHVLYGFVTAAERDLFRLLVNNVSGIGPKLEQKLNSLGVWHYAQISSWSQKEVDWVNAAISFRGRVEREKWVTQATALLEGAPAPAIGDTPL